MRKQLLSLCLPVALAFSAVPANAATILGFQAGVYVWATDASGTVGATDVAGMDGDNNVTFFALEHPVPLVPNVKVQLTDMAASSGANSVDLSHSDATLYYEILDNIVSIDIGITARTFDGEYNLGTTTAMDDSSYLLYAAAEVMIPVTGLSVGMEVSKDIGLDDNTIDDVKIRATYEIVGGLGVEIGQRTVTMTLEESAPNTNSLEFDGSYIALSYTF